MAEYTGYMKTTVDFDAMDIPHMAKTPLDQYREYVLESLFFQDHHGAVRATYGEHPIAATKEQIDALIEILAQWRDKA